MCAPTPVGLVVRLRLFNTWSLRASQGAGPQARLHQPPVPQSPRLHEVVPALLPATMVAVAAQHCAACEHAVCAHETVCAQSGCEGDGGGGGFDCA